MSSVIFFMPGKPNKSTGAQTLIGQEIGMVSSIFFSEESDVFVRFPNFEKKLKKDEKFGNWVNEIAVNNVDEYVIPDKCIVGTEKNVDFSATIAIYLRNIDKIELPKVYIPIPDSIFSSGNVADFKKLCDNSITVDHSSLKLYDNDHELNENMPITELFDFVKNSKLECSIEVPDSVMQRFKKRLYIIHELIDTEKKYIQNLEQIVNFWKPKFLVSTFFSQADMNLLFGDIPNIIKAQKKFFDDISKIKVSFTGQFFPVIIKNIENFKAGTHIIAYNHHVTELMNRKCRDNSKVLKMLQKLANESDGIEFLSYMIMPVQRIPRYALFLKELDKYSPSFHDDHNWAELARTKMSELTSFLDIEANKASKELKVQEIQYGLNTKFNLITPDRKLIDIYQITIIEKTHVSAYLIIFSNSIMVAKNNGKTFSIIYDSPSYCFHYAYVADNTLRLAINTSSTLKFLVVQFQKAEAMQQCLDCIDLVKNDFIIKYDSSFTLNWEVLRTSVEFPSCCSSSSVLYDGTFIFFGGKRTQQKLPAALLTAIRVSTLDCVEVTAIANGRYDHTVSLINDKLYVIGGRNKNKNKIFKKILSYNFKQEIWEQLILNGDESFIPRYGHTAVENGMTILIFGGKTQGGVLLNDLVTFDPISNSLHTINTPGGKPQQRYHHATVIIGDKLYLHGGKTKKGALNDLWMLDLTSMIWQQLAFAGDKLPPRYSHKMAAIGNYIIIFGGKGSDDLSTYAFDTEIFKCNKVLDAGNTPFPLRKACLCNDNENIYVYGGIEQNSSIPANVFYRVSLNPKWKKMLETIKPRVDPVAIARGRRKTTPVSQLYKDDEPDFDEIAQLTKSSLPTIPVFKPQQIRKSLISSSTKLTKEELMDYIEEVKENDDAPPLESIEIIPSQESEEHDEELESMILDDTDDEEPGKLEVFSLNPCSNKSNWKPNPATVQDKKMTNPKRPIMDVLTELLAPPEAVIVIPKGMKKSMSIGVRKKNAKSKALPITEDRYSLKQ